MAWWEAGARILLAILIGLAIGYERERRNKPAGTRTHILVCLGAALIAVMENYVEARVLAINTDVLNTGVAVSMGRISAQVVSGIGFLGAGTIFSSRKLRGDNGRVAVVRPGVAGMGDDACFSSSRKWQSAAACRRAASDRRA